MTTKASQSCARLLIKLDVASMMRRPGRLDYATICGFSASWPVQPSIRGNRALDLLARPRLARAGAREPRRHRVSLSMKMLAPHLTWSLRGLARPCRIGSPSRNPGAKRPDRLGPNKPATSYKKQAVELLSRCCDYIWQLAAGPVWLE